jgi:t-SNARE complex subunit (syntaxin)
MDQKKKLSVVIEHWIEHNESHKDEYKRWAQTAGELGLDSVKTEIEGAVEKLSQSNQHLEKALKAISS